MKERTGLGVTGVILTTVICFLVCGLAAFCIIAITNPDLLNSSRVSQNVIAANAAEASEPAEISVVTPVTVPTFTVAPSSTSAPAPNPVVVDPTVVVPGIYGTGATTGASAYEPTDPCVTSPAAASGLPTFVPSGPFPALNSYDYSTVVEIQNALGRNGYTVSVDGGYGPETATKVRQFQNAKQLSSIDGVTGPETAQALGITVTRNYHYEADLASIATTTTSEYLYYIATYGGATLTQFHRENGVWTRAWTTPISFNLSTDLSATNSLGVHVLPSGFPTGLFAFSEANYANLLASSCPSSTILVIDDRNFT